MRPLRRPWPACAAGILLSPLIGCGGGGGDAADAGGNGDGGGGPDSGNTQLNGQAISFLRNVFCNGADVPSSNAALYDNAGLAPIPAPGSPVCP